MGDLLEWCENASKVDSKHESTEDLARTTSDIGRMRVKI